MHFEQANSLKPHFSPFLALNGPFMGQQIFFSKIQKRHFSTLISGYLGAKNQKKLMAGNMRTCVADGLTDGQTDGARLLRTRASPKNPVQQKKINSNG